MNPDIPYWHKVLRHFDKHHYFNNGLTIPFLIGSRTIVEPQGDVIALHEFIEGINASITPISILKCQNIKEYVINLLDHETNSLRKGNGNPFLEIGNIICIDLSLKDIISQTDLINMLTELYHVQLKNGNYSKVRDKWISFTPLEKERLLEVRI
ncbi:MAG: hypothetical protein IPP25_18195 [Saprospiraceae bacterium]|nr:hypothetical protein [Candidatus Opimibacter skivensis]